MNRLTVLLLAISALAAGVLAYFLIVGMPGQKTYQYEQMTALPDARALPDFELLDQTGAVFGASDFAGSWSVLFFGFTHCPDICPATLYQLSQMQKALDDLPASLHPAVYMVSVDVARDTPEVMAQYVRAFNSTFRGISGDADELQRLASALGVAYGIEAKEDGSYDVLHTTALFILNDAGEFAAVASAPHDPAALARDYRKLITSPGA